MDPELAEGSAPPVRLQSASGGQAPRQFRNRKHRRFLQMARRPARLEAAYMISYSPAEALQGCFIVCYNAYNSEV